MIGTVIIAVIASLAIGIWIGRIQHREVETAFEPTATDHEQEIRVATHEFKYDSTQDAPINILETLQDIIENEGQISKLNFEQDGQTLQINVETEELSV